MHDHLTRHRPAPLTDDECAVRQDEELAVAREELDALKEGLDASYRSYRQAATRPTAFALRAMLQQTLLALHAVERQRGVAESP